MAMEDLRRLASNHLDLDMLHRRQSIMLIMDLGRHLSTVSTVLVNSSQAGGRAQQFTKDI